MSGIVGVTGDEPAVPALLVGLARLEDRRYDSVGVAVLADSGLWRRRRTGRVADIVPDLDGIPAGHSGIGHTRWATHGTPTARNAHPHVDCDGTIAVVHKGIIANHRELRAKLEAGRHRLTSETDSEVLAHLLEDAVASGLDLPAAVRELLRVVHGSLAIAVIRADEPGLVVAARRGSPLVVGRTDTGGFLASDASALLPFTDELYAVGDNLVVEVRPGVLWMTDADGRAVPLERRGVGFDPGAVARGDFPDFMLKEIHEQPKAITATLGGRRRGEKEAPARWVPPSVPDPATLRRVVLVGSGTGHHAGLAVRPAFEELAGLATTCEVASELRSAGPMIEPGTLVVGISRSGETTGTLHALREAAAAGAHVLALTNVVGSAMAREAGSILYTSAGPEMGVAATKTHLAQVVALHGLALGLAAARGTVSQPQVTRQLAALRALPGAVERALHRRAQPFALARALAETRDVFLLGRGPGYATALEGALKLKEIAHIRAEAYPAGELEHGPIALIEPGVVVIAVVGAGRVREKMLSHVAQVRARGASVVLLAAEDDEALSAIAGNALTVEPADRFPGPMSHVVSVVPLQLLAYALAKEKGYDVDKPRYLAKTVTAR